MWVTTKDGRQVNTDWFDQERQIEASKAEADERNNQPEFVGKHTVYRSGDLSGSATGLIYFATDKETANSYGKQHSFKYNGQTIKVPKRETIEYEVKVKNPLIIESDDDLYCAIKTYNVLYPDRHINHMFKDNSISKYAKQDGFSLSGTNSIQIYLDSMIGKAMKKNKNYDSIVYITHRGYSQLIVPAGSKAIKKKG